jgi:hypothetical protein
VIVTPQDGPAGEDCGLVAVASGFGAALFAGDGAEVCEQPGTGEHERDKRAAEDV